MPFLFLNRGSQFGDRGGGLFYFSNLGEIWGTPSGAWTTPASLLRITPGSVWDCICSNPDTELWLATYNIHLYYILALRRDVR